jgi:hypothetical protein
MSTNNTNNAGPNLGHVAALSAQIAQGAPVSTALKNVVKDASLDALLGPAAIFGGSLIGALKTMRAIVDQSGILERNLKNVASVQGLQGKFETLLKSADLANKRIRDLYKFAANAPFKFDDIAEGNRVLEALTRGALSGAKGMKIVGDSAAATGESFTEAAERIGKLYNALSSGRSMDKVLFQLQATGAVTDDLAAKLEQAEASGQGFGAMWAVVEKSLASTEGGMASEMKTLGGLTAQLETAGQVMTKAFGQPFEIAQTKAIEATIAATKNLTPVLAQMGNDMAPLLTFFGNLKNSAALSILSIDGFSRALVVAWKASAMFFAGISAAALASVSISAWKAKDTILSFAGALNTAVKAQAALRPMTYLADAAEAAKAAANGQLLLALSLKATSLWSRASRAAMILHTAAMQMAGAAIGQFNVVTYIAAIATGGLAKAATVAWGALRVMTAGLAGQIVAVLTNPLYAALIAIGALVTAAKYWAEGVAAVNQEYIKLIFSISATNDKLNEQRRNIKNLDDWRDSLRNVGEALAKVNEELDNPNLTRDDRAALEHHRTNLEGRVSQFGKDDLSKLGKGKEELTVLQKDVGEVRATNESNADLQLGNADGVKRAALLRANAARHGPDAATGKAVNDDRWAFERSAAGRRVATNDAMIAGFGDADAHVEAARKNLAAVGGTAPAEGKMAGIRRDAADTLNAALAGRDRRNALVTENAALRSNAGSELVRVQQKINDLKTAGLPATDALLRRQFELVTLSEQYGDNLRKANDEVDQANKQDDQNELAKIELDYAERIAAEKAKGGETATLEAQKQLALLEKQIVQAGRLGNASDVARLTAEKSGLLGDQAKFRADVGLERAKNVALADRNPQLAQALQDNAELQKLRDQYTANGMTEGQADADFKQGLLGAAGTQVPTIIADSLQRVGGGGGSYGTSPIDAAAKRADDAQTMYLPFLKLLYESATGKGQGIKP